MSLMTVRSPAQITGIAPQFLVDDLDRAVTYYVDRLGFELDFLYESFYASVRRDGFAIHLKQAAKLAADRAHRNRTTIWTRTLPCPVSEVCSASCRCVGRT